MLKLLPLKNIYDLNKYMDSSLVDHRHSSRHLCCLINDGLFIAFHYCSIEHSMQDDEHVYICTTKDNLILACDNKHISELFSCLPENSPPFSALVSLLSMLTEKDVDKLEKIENNITELEDRLITSKHCTSKFGAEIMSKRRFLLRIKRYYEQLGIVTSDMLTMSGELMSDEERNFLAVIDRRLDHLLSSVVSLREYTTQVREAYQAQIDIEQNQIMKILTVITSVFLPLTLVAGWYGMNFSMPEYGWKYGYAYVIALSILSVTLCIFFFRKNNLK